MKEKTKQIESLLDCVSDMQEQGCHQIAFEIARMAQVILDAAVDELRIKVSLDELP